MTEPLKNEYGYSLVEVLAAIVILTIAIIPMVTMFDTGLRSASTSGNYDRARALANMKLEEAKSLPYDAVKDASATGFPSGATKTGCGSGCIRSNYVSVTGAAASDFSGLEYSVEKQFLKHSSNAASQNFSEPPYPSTDQGLLRIKVTVQWSSGNTYSATGMVVE